ncbi:unnamed protein product [Cylindrotheca closterium]|uniref:Uncharacterized protein n=1 Tax=Cylindrotheca closterium TaxID=2856 RepID=A0AAD2FEY7_9STRA|nr:unnamed protein product [Cylindrotheca closterium]
MGKRTIASPPPPIPRLPFMPSNMVEVILPSHKQQNNRSAIDQLRSCYLKYSSLVSLMVILVIFLLLDWPKSSRHTLTVQTESYSKIAIPIHEVIDEIDVLWAAPTKRESNKSSPCGILFVAHGCNHAHTDWFVKCPQGCLGLPEEVAIVDLALERNLVVVAVSSENRDFKCWLPEVDGPRVASVLQKISEKYAPASSLLPIWAFGASSGGALVSVLGNYIKLQGYLSQIMARPPEQTIPESCIVYLTMEHDSMTRSMAKQILASRITDGRNAQHIRLPPLAISSPDFFSKRIGSVSNSNSESMVQSLQQGGFLDSQGYLKDDPRGSDWRSAVQPFAESDTLMADQSAISEVMNAAYSMHEMSREGVAKGLDFCMSVLPSSSSACG